MQIKSYYEGYCLCYWDYKMLITKNILFGILENVFKRWKHWVTSLNSYILLEDDKYFSHILLEESYSYVFILSL